MSHRPTTHRLGSDLTIDRRGLLRGAGILGALTATGLLVPATRAVAADKSVETIQTDLQGLDYYDGLIDGDAGPMTQQATRDFQTDRRLVVDGDPGPLTQEELTAVITAVQEALEVETTGTFDAATTEATASYQSGQGLAESGRADADTMAALGVERAKQPVGGEPGAEISRADVIERAMFWVDDPRPYSMEGTSDGIDGKQWRRDCSGFTCMSWNLRRSDGDTGTGTGQLPEVLDQITKDDLKVGDALLIPPWDNGASYGHVVLFNGWTDDGQTEYECLEQVGSPYSQTMRRTVPYPYDSGNAELYTPYRYPQIVD